MYSVQISPLTIKYSTTILCGGGQRFAGGVQFVAIITDADLKLDWFTRLLEHACTVENCAQGILPPPLVFLQPIKKMWECYNLIPHCWLEVFYPCSGPHLDYVNENKLLVFVSA